LALTAKEMVVRTVLKVHPRDKGALRSLVITLWNGDDYGQALDVLHELIEWWGGESSDHLNRGATLDRLGRHGEALLAFEKTFVDDTGVDPSDAFIWAFHAEIGRSIAIHRAAVQHRPCDAGAWIRLGLACEHRARTSRRQEGEALDDEAIAAYKEAIRLEPTDYLPYFRLVIRLDELGRRPEAAQYCRLYRLQRLQAVFPEWPFVAARGWGVE
jgi:tetratricopeptide (TPR) repeat protein